MSKHDHRDDYTRAAEDALPADDAAETQQTVIERVSAMIGGVVTDLNEKKSAHQNAVAARKAAEKAEQEAGEAYIQALKDAQTSHGLAPAMLKEFGHATPRGGAAVRKRGTRRPRRAAAADPATVAGSGNLSVHHDMVATKN